MRIKIWTIGFLLIFLAGCGTTPWLIKETANLSIYYKQGSYAEKHLLRAAEDYEYSIKEALAFIPGNNQRQKVKVYLYDDLKYKGFAKVKKREVHYRYSEQFRLTSAHEFMHVLLYELNPKAPLRLEEGICRIKEGKSKIYEGQRIVTRYYHMVKFTPESAWTVNEVFKDRYKDDDEGNIAGAFAAFAMERLGPDTFWAFYQELDKRNWKTLLPKYFNQDSTSLDAAFKNFVRAIPTPHKGFDFKNLK